VLTTLRRVLRLGILKKSAPPAIPVLKRLAWGLGPVRSSTSWEVDAAVKACIVFRITGNIMQLDGFVRDFEHLDDLEIVAICCPKDTPGHIDENCFCTFDETSLDLHFGIALSAESTYELVMEQYHQRAEMGIRIEVVDDRTGTAEEPLLVRPSAR
jgi:hypothetical protein